MYTNFKDTAGSCGRPDATFLDSVPQVPIVPNNIMGKQTSGSQWNISRPNPLHYGYRPEAVGNNQLMLDSHYQNCPIRPATNTTQRIVRPTARINCQANCNGLAYCNHNYPVRNAQQWNLPSENTAAIPVTSSKRPQQFPPTDPRLHNHPATVINSSVNNFSRYPGDTISAHHGNVPSYKEDTSQDRSSKHHLSNNGMSSKKEPVYDCRVGCSSNCPHVQQQNSCTFPSQIPLNVSLQQTPGHWISNSHVPSDAWGLQDDPRQMMPIEGVDMTVQNPVATKYWSQRKPEAKPPEITAALREMTRKLQHDLQQTRYRDNHNKDQRKMLDWCADGARSGSILPPYPADRFPEPDLSGNSNSRSMHPSMSFDPYAHQHSKIMQHNYNPESSHLHSRLTSNPSYLQGKVPKGNFLQSQVAPAHSNNYISVPHDNIPLHLNHNMDGNNAQTATKMQYMTSVQSYNNASLNSCNEMFENVNYGHSMQVMENACHLTNKNTLSYQHDVPQPYENMLQQESNSMVGNMFYDGKNMSIKQMGFNSFYGNSASPSQSQNHIPSPFNVIPQSNIGDSVLSQNVPVKHHPVVATDTPALIDGRPVKKRKHQREDVAPIATKGSEKVPIRDLRQFLSTWDENEETELPHSNITEVSPSKKTESMFVLDCTNLERSNGEPNAGGRKSDEGVIQLFKVGLNVQDQETFASVIKPLSECRKALEDIRPSQKYRYKSIQEASLSSLQRVTEKNGSPLYTHLTASETVVGKDDSINTPNSELVAEGTSSVRDHPSKKSSAEPPDRPIFLSTTSDSCNSDPQSTATILQDNLELTGLHSQHPTTSASNCEHQQGKNGTKKTEESPSPSSELQEKNVLRATELVLHSPKDLTCIQAGPNVLHSPRENNETVLNDSNSALELVVPKTHGNNPILPMIVEKEALNCKQNDAHSTSAISITSLDDQTATKEENSTDALLTANQKSNQSQECENSVIKYISSEDQSENTCRGEVSGSTVTVSGTALHSANINVFSVDTANTTHFLSEEKKEHLEEPSLELLPDTDFNYLSTAHGNKPVKIEEFASWKGNCSSDKKSDAACVALTEIQTSVNESSDDIALELHPSYDEAFYGEFENDTSSVDDTTVNLEKDGKEVSLSLNESTTKKLKEEGMLLKAIAVDLSDEDSDSVASVSNNSPGTVTLHSNESRNDCEIIDVEHSFEDDILCKLDLHKDENNKSSIAISESYKYSRPGNEGNGSHNVSHETTKVENKTIHEPTKHNNLCAKEMLCDVDLSQQIDSSTGNYYSLENDRIRQAKGGNDCSLTSSSNKVSKYLELVQDKEELSEPNSVGLCGREALTDQSGHTNVDLDNNEDVAIERKENIPSCMYSVLDQALPDNANNATNNDLGESTATVKITRMEKNADKIMELAETDRDLNIKLKSIENLCKENEIVMEECSSVYKEVNDEHSVHDVPKVQPEEHFQPKKETEKKEVMVQKYENFSDTFVSSSESSNNKTLQEKVLNKELNNMNYVENAAPHRKLVHIHSPDIVESDNRNLCNEENSADEDFDMEQSTRENTSENNDMDETASHYDVDCKVHSRPSTPKNLMNLNKETSLETVELTEMYAEESNCKAKIVLYKPNETVTIGDNTIQGEMFKAVNLATANIEESSTGNNGGEEEENKYQESPCGNEDLNNQSDEQEEDLVQEELCEDTYMEMSCTEESNSYSGTDEEDSVAEDVFENLCEDMPDAVEAGDNVNMEEADADASQANLPENMSTDSPVAVESNDISSTESSVAVESNDIISTESSVAIESRDISSTESSVAIESHDISSTESSVAVESSDISDEALQCSAEGEMYENTALEIRGLLESSNSSNEYVEVSVGKAELRVLESDHPDVMTNRDSDVDDKLSEVTDVNKSVPVESNDNGDGEVGFFVEEDCVDVDVEMVYTGKQSTDDLLSVLSSDQSSGNKDVGKIATDKEIIDGKRSETSASVESYSVIKNTTKHLCSTPNFKSNMSLFNIEKIIAKKTFYEETDIEEQLALMSSHGSTCLQTKIGVENTAEIESHLGGNCEKEIPKIVSSTETELAENSIKLDKGFCGKSNSRSLYVSCLTSANEESNQHVLSSEDDSSIDVETVDLASHMKFVESASGIAVYSDACNQLAAVSPTVPGEEDSDMPSLELNLPLSPNNSESLEMPCLEIMTDDVCVDAEWNSPRDVPRDAEKSLLGNPFFIKESEDASSVCQVIASNSEGEPPESSFSNDSVHNWPYLEEEVFSETPRAPTQSPQIETACSGHLMSPVPESESDSEMPSPQDLACVPCNNDIVSYNDKTQIEKAHIKCRLSWDKIFNLSNSNEGKSRGIESNRKELLKKWPCYTKQGCNTYSHDDQQSSMCDESGDDSDSAIGLELGPAKIEVRLTQKPMHEQWQVVDSPGGVKTSPAVRPHEENNNIVDVSRVAENSITRKSPIVLVRRIILKRRADDVSVTSSNSSLSQLDCDPEIRGLTTPPASDDGCTIPKTHALPKVIIKRMRNGQEKYQSFLRVSATEENNWQPVVRLKRIKLIEDMTKKLIRTTCLGNFNNTPVDTNEGDRDEEETGNDHTALADKPDFVKASKAQILSHIKENIANINEPILRGHSTETNVSFQFNQNSVDNAETGIDGKVIKNNIVKHIVKPSETDGTHSGKHVCKITKHSRRRRQLEGFQHGNKWRYKKRFGSESGSSRPLKKRQNNFKTKHVQSLKWKSVKHRTPSMNVVSESELSGGEEKPNSSLKSNLTKEINIGAEVSNDAVIELCQACDYIYQNDAEKSMHIKTHAYHCQRCNIAFKSEVHFESHLSAEHPHSKEIHHCLLCKMCFTSAADHQEHLKERQHLHLDLTQRWTIQTLFTMFTGSPCSRLQPLTDTEVAEMNSMTDAEPGAINYYHQATPLQLAMKELLDGAHCLTSTNTVANGKCGDPDASVE